VLVLEVLEVLVEELELATELSKLEIPEMDMQSPCD
jgi:hypothetical protein